MGKKRPDINFALLTRSKHKKRFFWQIHLPFITMCARGSVC